MGEELGERSEGKLHRLEGDEGGKVEGKNEWELGMAWWLRNRSTETEKRERQRGGEVSQLRKRVDVSPPFACSLTVHP